MTDQASYLGPWLHEPTIIAPVQKCVEEAGRPVTLIDICQITGFTREQVARSLTKLSDKRLVKRTKTTIVQQGRHWTGKTMQIRRQVWLYEPACPRE